MCITIHNQLEMMAGLTILQSMAKINTTWTSVVQKGRYLLTASAAATHQQCSVPNFKVSLVPQYHITSIGPLHITRWPIPIHYSVVLHSKQINYM
jgi:hypothetical protein